MKPVLAVSRVIVGTLFVLSGLIKANDPYGFSYKLKEYFEVFTHDLAYRKVPAPIDSNAAAATQTVCPEKFKPKQEMVDEEIPESERGFFKNKLIDLFTFINNDNPDKKPGIFAFIDTVFLAVFICVLEIVLGALTVTGYSMRITSWLLFLMILFFTFLTFYSAQYNKVTDCGCFGDALKLTPWQSFYKDIFLLVFVLPLFIFQKRIKGTPLNGWEWGISIASLVMMTVLCFVQFKWFFPVWFLLLVLGGRILFAKISKPAVAQIMVVLLSGIGSTLFANYTINHLAVKDYRPWKVGNDLRELVKGEPEQSKVMLVYVNNKTCEEVEISFDKKDPAYKDFSDTLWFKEHTFLDQKKKVIKEAVSPKVKDFTLDDEETGIQVGDSLINKHSGYAFLFVARDLKESKISEKGWEKIRGIASYAESNGIWFLGATSSYGEEIEKFRHENQLAFKFYVNDGTALKTILRPGPGLVLLKDGVVMGKWQWNDIPSLEKLQSKYLQ